MTFKSISIGIALALTLATQGAAQSKSLTTTKDTGPSPYQSFGTKQSKPAPFGQVHPEWNCYEVQGYEFCEMVMMYCEKDFGCTEL